MLPMLGSQTACARQCEEQCLLDMLQSADAAVACAPGDALGPGTARDDRAGDAGAALAMDNDVIVRQQTGGLVSSACEGPEQAGAAPASAAVLPGAGSPVCSAADAGAAAIGGHSSVPVAGDGVGAGHADAVGLTGAALPGTHDGYAGEYDRGPGRGEREGKGNAA